MAEELGRVAYEAFVLRMKERYGAVPERFSSWDSVSEGARECWEAAGAAVEAAVLERAGQGGK